MCSLMRLNGIKGQYKYLVSGARPSIIALRLWERWRLWQRTFSTLSVELWVIRGSSRFYCLTLDSAPDVIPNYGSSGWFYLFFSVPHGKSDTFIKSCRINWDKKHCQCWLRSGRCIKNRQSQTGRSFLFQGKFGSFIVLRVDSGGF